MAHFTVRVEFHDGSMTHYLMLYKELAARSFADTIEAEKVTYKLPTGEFNYEGNKTKDQVLALVKDAAARVFRSYSILVTESSGRRFFNLRKV